MDVVDTTAFAIDFEDRDDFRTHPEARLPVLVFRAMGSGGLHIYCKSLADAVERLARGLKVLREVAGLERQTGDP